VGRTRPTGRRSRRRGAGAGLLLYALFLWNLTGDPLVFAKSHAAWGRTYQGLGALASHHYELVANAGLSGYVGAAGYDVLNLLGALFAAATLWPVCRRVGLAYGVFMLASILPPLASGGFLSVGRFSAVLFPAFIWLASRSRRLIVPAGSQASRLSRLHGPSTRGGQFFATLSRTRCERARLADRVDRRQLTWPQALHLGTRIPEHSDPLLSIWRLAWIAHAVPNDLGPCSTRTSSIRTCARWRIPTRCCSRPCSLRPGCGPT
jgi:hypothetical protein